MAKKKIEKLTIDNLIARKLEREKNEIKVKEIEVPSLGGTLLFNKPLDDYVFDVFDMLKDNPEDLRTIAEAYTDLIYHCCPTLKEMFKNKLTDAQVPSDLVKEVFTLSDRLTIGNELVEMSGLSKENLGEEVKKQ